MHYVLLRNIVTKLFDGDLKTLEQIKDVFTAAKEKEYDCEIILKNSMHYTWLRVVEVKETNIVATVILNPKSSLKKTFDFNDIATFVIRSSGEEAIRKSTDGEVSRWSILDISDNDLWIIQKISTLTT